MAINSKTWLREVATLNTTDGVANEIWSYTLPDDCTAWLTWRIQGRDEATPAHGFHQSGQVWYRSNGGGATVLGSGNMNNINRLGTGWSVTEGESSNDIQLFVNGDNDDVEWVAFIEFTLVEAN